MNNRGISPPPAGMCLLMGRRSWESFLFGMPFEMKWIHSLGGSTDGGSAVVGLVQGDELM